jgi:hypothetical protein
MYEFNSKLLHRSILDWFEEVTWRNGYAYKVSDLLFADPILQLLANYHWATLCGSVNVRFVDESLLYTRPIRRNNYLAGLRIIFQMGRRRRKLVYSGFPSWNRRRAAALNGSTSSKGERFLYEISAPNWTSPSGISTDPDVKARSTTLVPKVTGGYDTHMYFNDIVHFAHRMRKYVDQSFYRPRSLSRFTSHTLKNLKVSARRISYILENVVAQMYPSKIGASAGSIKVTIENVQLNGQAPAVYVTLEGIERARGRETPNTFDLNFSNAIVHRSKLDSGQDQYVIPGKLLQIERFARHFRIDWLRGALYHTQGKALSKIMIDLDRNFEAVVEAPEFFPSLADFAAKHFPSALRNVLLKPKDAFEHLRGMASLLSGDTLALSFGIIPAVQSLKALIEGYTVPLEGEAELQYNRSSVWDLPDGLDTMCSDALIHAFGHDVVDAVRIRFRTQVWAAPDYQAFVQKLYNEDILFRLGAFPTPLGVWKATRFSFMVDWGFPISSWMRDHQSYFLSFTVPCRYGHTASFEFDLQTGETVSLFLRSSQHSFPLDPPEISWLESSGPSAHIAIALGTQIALGVV